MSTQNLNMFYFILFQEKSARCSFFNDHSPFLFKNNFCKAKHSNLQHINHLHLMLQTPSVYLPVHFSYHSLINFSLSGAFSAQQPAEWNKYKR